MHKGSKRHLFSLLFILFTLFAGAIFYYFPIIGEEIYGQKLYPIIRELFDLILKPFDFSIILIFIGFLIFKFVHALLNKGILAFVKLIFIVLAMFYWLWGFNYYRTSLSDKLEMEFSSIDDSTHLALTLRTLEECKVLSLVFNDSIKTSYDGSLLNSSIKVAESFSFLSPSKVQSVPVFPSSIFLRIGIMGMYFPFTGQAQHEIELGPIDRPHTLAHEWCHASGIGPEHEADFLAYLICISNEDPRVQYSAKMNLLFELIYYYKISDPEKFENMLSSFTPIMVTQIEARREQIIEYTGPISEMSDEMIDRYLKMHKQQGLRDYHRLSEYVYAWEN